MEARGNRKGLWLLLGGLLAAEAVGATELTPLRTRWTFGAHEPYSMYRRMGRKATGGIEGSAKWLKDWLDWWDAKAPERMEELGLNALHSRFYKGMGWEFEKRDFPNVKRFVENCHRHGVTALAYVQFSTLYPEPMKLEIPDLDDWAQVDEHGEKRLWNGYYFRWMPCVTSEAWQAYIEKLLGIALTDGGFDGIMFDNVFVPGCYCERCERKFREHLATLPDFESRFGFPVAAFTGQPRPTERDQGRDVKDPLLQEWYRWRVANVNRVMARFRAKIKAVKPDAIVSANAQPFRGIDNPGKFSLEMISFAENLDLFMMQSDSFPGYDAKTGMVINRVRDLKLAAALGKPIVALCDANAGQYALDESAYTRPLMEDLVFGGIPTDRTVMSPDRSPTFIDEKRFAERRAKLAEFNAFAKARAAAFSGPAIAPVRILYPADALMFSRGAHAGITAAEEILLRNHVPFGYLFVRGAAAAEVPADCDALVVAGQEWLSDAQLAMLADWARGGGKLVVTGECGLWDESGAQRFENPLRQALAGLANVRWRDTADRVDGKLGWKYRVMPPKDGGSALMDDLAAVGYRPRFAFTGLPDFVFTEVRRTADGFAVHFVNYNPGHAVSGATVNGRAVPEFTQYTLMEF